MEATNTKIWDAGRKRVERGRRIVGKEERRKPAHRKMPADRFEDIHYQRISQGSPVGRLLF